MVELKILGEKRILILSLVPVLIYLNSITGEFVHDDIPAIVKNPDVTGSSGFIKLLQSDYWGENLQDSRSHKSFRPLTTATFRLTATIFGLSPVWYHVINILLHSFVSSFLYFILIKRIQLNKETSSLISLLFSLHPIHTEAVSGIVGRADLLTCLFMLVSFYLSTSHPNTVKKELGSHLCVVLGLMSKEIGLTVLIINILFILLTRTGRVDWRRFVSSICLLVLLTTARIAYNKTQPSFIDQDNPASHDKNFLTRLRTYIYLGVFNINKLLCPDSLSYDWQMGSVPLLHSCLDLRNLYSILLCSTLLGILYRVLENKEAAGDGSHKMKSYGDGSKIESDGIDSTTMTNGFTKIESDGFSKIEDEDEMDKDDSSKIEDEERFEKTVSGTVYPVYRNGDVNDNISEEADLSITDDDCQSFQKSLAFGLLFLVVPFLPASNMFFQVGFVAAERILYVPSIGFCVLVALGARKLLVRMRGYREGSMRRNGEGGIREYRWMREYGKGWTEKMIQILILITLLSFGGKTFTRNFAWNSRLALFRSGLQSTQTNAKIFYNYGNMALDNGNQETAKLCYKEAIRLWPSYVIAWNNLATLSDNETEIEFLLRKALLLDPSHTTSLYNLADLYRQRRHYKKAVYYFSICLKFRECQPTAVRLLSDCKEEVQKLKLANNKHQHHNDLERKYHVKNEPGSK